MDRPRIVPRPLPIALAAAALLGSAAAAPAAADDELQVVASIKPVHSLVSAVMAGVGEPHLIIRGQSSPHTFTMRPSDAAALEDADIVFMVGDTIESSLVEPVEALAGHARVVKLVDTPGLVLRRVREGGAFEDHDHDSHGHEGMDDHHDHADHDDHEDEEDHADHDDHADDDDHMEHADHDDHEEDHAAVADDHDDEHGHGHEDHHDEAMHRDDDHDDHGHGHDDHDGHADDHDDHGSFDMHVWLDPINGWTLARTIAGALAEVDPANAATYEANVDDLLHRLDHLTEEIAQEVAPARGVPFIVFHDAYRYFEDRFGLTAAGSVVISPERAPGARRISELREKLSELGVVCVFDEPQFDERLVRTVVEGSDVRSATVDPLGATIEDGPELYFTLLRNMATAFKDCLAPDEGA